jgi:hypothetical protein
MQLKMTRGERKTLFGRTSYTLDVSASYERSERDFLQQNKLWRDLIYGTMVPDTVWSLVTGKRGAHITAASLEKGQTIYCDTFQDLMASEREIERGCARVASHLNAAGSGERERVVDFGP